MRSLPAAGDAPCRAPSRPPCDPAWSEHHEPPVVALCYCS